MRSYFRHLSCIWQGVVGACLSPEPRVKEQQLYAKEARVCCVKFQNFGEKLSVFVQRETRRLSEVSMSVCVVCFFRMQLTEPHTQKKRVSGLEPHLEGVWL